MFLIRRIKSVCQAHSVQRPSIIPKVAFEFVDATFKLITLLIHSTMIAPTREQMSEARLPIRYRDSCAGLLIPLNRCRFEENYLPWKCEVSLMNNTHIIPTKLTKLNLPDTDREAFI